MQLELENKTVLVTGASRGIGRDIAAAFVGAGALVYSGCRSKESFDELAAANLNPVMLDVTSQSEFTSVIQSIIEKHGRLDVLVNNAGVASNTPASSLKPEEVDRLIDTNFKGVFYGMQAYYKAQRKSGGIIVNVASILGLVGTPLASVYCGTKGAVVQMTRALAVEWANSGFRVNAVAPGFIDTDMTEVMKKRDSILTAVLNNIPVKRMGTPRDIAGPVLFLASSLADYMTGHILVVDGGLTAQ